MGFLNKLWDETLAGPMPDTGLSKLRKYKSFSGTRSTPPPPPPPPLPLPLSSGQVAAGTDCVDHEVQVTRSITILRNNSNPLGRNLSIDVPGSEPDSPTSSTPRTPVTPATPAENLKRPWTRTKSGGAGTSAPTERASEQRSRHAYDWIVISSLDR